MSEQKRPKLYLHANSAGDAILVGVLLPLVVVIGIGSTIKSS